MSTYNPMLMNVDEKSGDGNVVDKNFIVTAKSDDDETYYVLSEGMQTTLKEYEKGNSKINIKGNPIIDKYEKFVVDGKEFYGVKKDKYGAVGSGDQQFFDTYKWEFDTDTKKARYYGGQTELSKIFDKMDIPSEYKEYVREDEFLEESFNFDEIPL